MTSQCLLAAEADQIQDFVFRAARLREIVGGSQLLARFCDKGVRALLTHPRYGGDPATDIIISDGGAFRLIFKGEDEENAKAKAAAFGRDLCELYRRAAGGSLTVALPPVAFSDENDFHRANDEAQKLLRRAKREGDKPAATAHLPYVAFCASCGLALAAAHRKKVAAEDVRANYLCSDCSRKDAEQLEQRRNERRQQPEGFIEEFRHAVRRHLAQMMSPAEVEGISLSSPERGDWPEMIGSRRLDPRRYVAYMVADGNDMGRLFDGCDRQQMKELSQILTQALRESLAAPCATLIACQEKVQGLGILPVLPLILGGDDLFALLPAPWAINFAARFCREYEQRLGAALREINLFDEQHLPTIATAVVVCKATYPHTLAHERAYHALKEAKAVARRLKIEGIENAATGRNYQASVLNFTVVTGSQISVDNGGAENFYRARLRPYFIGDDAPEEWGVNIERLLEARLTLRALPGKRRSELAQLYEIPPVGKEEQANDDLKQRWRPELDRLLARIGPKESKLHAALEDALSQLGAGAANQGFWGRTRRESTDEWRANGLPDLLEVWDFAFRADKRASDYEGE